MAEGTDKDQKTHDPTEKRLADARQKGEIPISSEMRHAVMFVGILIVLGGMGAWTFNRLAALLVGLLSAKIIGLSQCWAMPRMISGVKSPGCPVVPIRTVG